MYEDELLDYDQIRSSIQGWFAYAIWANTYTLRKEIIKKVNIMFSEEPINIKF